MVGIKGFSTLLVDSFAEKNLLNATIEYVYTTTILMTMPMSSTEYDGTENA